MANWVEKLCSKFNANLAAGLFIIASLALLNGCQGISEVNIHPNSPGTLRASPSSLSFGNVTVGKNQNLSGTVTNSGGSGVTVSQIGILTRYRLHPERNHRPFDACRRAKRTHSASCSLRPLQVMQAVPSRISSNASNSTMSVSLTGMGTTAAGQLESVSPSTIAVSNVVDGASGTASGNLTASGAMMLRSPQQVSAPALRSSISGFRTFPVTIPEGQSVPFTITFSPTAVGSASATLTATSNAQPSTSTGTLTGTGDRCPVGQLSIFSVDACHRQCRQWRQWYELGKFERKWG